jgi:hypothetical protein
MIRPNFTVWQVSLSGGGKYMVVLFRCKEKKVIYAI